MKKVILALFCSMFLSQAQAGDALLQCFKGEKLVLNISRDSSFFFPSGSKEIQALDLKSYEVDPIHYAVDFEVESQAYGKLKIQFYDYDIEIMDKDLKYVDSYTCSKVCEKVTESKMSCY